MADSHNNRVQRFTSNGAFISQWGTSGSSDGEFSTPFGVAIDGTGNVYVTDYGNLRVQKFTSDGQFIRKWGGSGSGQGQFGPSNSASNGPAGIAVDGAGDVHVIDQGNNRIQKFTGDGAFLTAWGSWGSGAGAGSSSTFDGPMASRNGTLYLADTSNSQIVQLSIVSTPVIPSTWGQIKSLYR